MAINSNINTNVDENFPVAGITQSSQGFRDNFSVIKNSLISAKSEIQNLQSKRLVVSGDLTGTSSIIDSGSGTFTLGLNLKSSGATSGTYNTLSQDVVFTVNSKGIITSISSTPKATFPVSGNTSNDTTITNFGPATTSNRTGTLSIQIPTFNVDQYGRIISKSTKTLEGFGLIGHNMPKGSILVGSGNVPNEQSTFLSTGANGQILTIDSTTPTGLKWINFPNIPGGTLTGINPGQGINVSGSSVSPTVNLGINLLSNLNPITPANDDYILIYDSSSSSHRKLSWNEVNQVLSSSYLTQLEDDTNPDLGGDLSVGTNKITNRTANDLVIESHITSRIILDNQKWPKTSGTNGQVLSTDSSGNLSWVSVSGSVSNISAGNGLVTSPSGGITTTGTVSLSLESLPTKNYPEVTDNIPIVDSSDIHHKIPLSSFIPDMGVNVYFVSPNGIDAVDSGSILKPFNTITYALSIIPLDSTLILGRGNYPENIIINKPIRLYSMVEYIESSITSITITNSASTGLFGVVMKNITTGNLLIECGSNLSNIQMDECRIISSSTGITISGTMSNDIVFNRCLIVGGILNNANGSAGNKYVYINSETSSVISRSRLSITTSDNSNTVIKDLQSIAGVRHNGGNLIISNVNTLSHSETISDFFDKVIISTANSGKLLLTNTSTLQLNGSYSRIQKTGTCPYRFINVNRDPSQDTITGNRLDYQTSQDIGEGVVVQTITSTYTINTKLSRVFDLTVNGANIQLNLVGDNSTTNQNFAHSLTVLLRGTGNANNYVTFNSTDGIVWENGTQPAMNTGTDKVTIYTFVKIGNGSLWYGSRSFLQQ